MHMINDKGEAVYFNPIRKNGKDQWLIQGIGSTIVLGRDRQRRYAERGPRSLPFMRSLRKNGAGQSPPPTAYNFARIL